MRFGKLSFRLHFAIAIENRTTEHNNKHHHGENERTKRSPHVG
jgi:hypothetical protein